MKKMLGEKKVYDLLEGIDKDLAEEARGCGCSMCGGRLHRADYGRKPRGGPCWEKRYSFCCAEEGCRKRMTPRSVRFLGRRVYAGIVVVLVSAMLHGVSEARVQRLREALGIDKRTLERWRAWWVETFVSGDFWRAQRGRFMPSIDEGRLPLTLVEAFDTGGWEGLVKLMRFLSPITTSSWKQTGAM